MEANPRVHGPALPPEVSRLTESAGVGAISSYVGSAPPSWLEGSVPGTRELTWPSLEFGPAALSYSRSMTQKDYSRSGTPEPHAAKIGTRSSFDAAALASRSTALER